MFQGGADPLRYEEWMRRLENLFEIINCLAKFQVDLAMYQFEGEAEYWRETVKLRGDEPPITWERLMELMDITLGMLKGQRNKSFRVRSRGVRVSWSMPRNLMSSTVLPHLKWLLKR